MSCISEVRNRCHFKSNFSSNDKFCLAAITILALTLIFSQIAKSSEILDPFFGKYHLNVSILRYACGSIMTFMGVYLLIKKLLNLNHQTVCKPNIENSEVISSFSSSEPLTPSVLNSFNHALSFNYSCICSKDYRNIFTKFMDCISERSIKRLNYTFTDSPANFQGRKEDRLVICEAVFIPVIDWYKVHKEICSLLEEVQGTQQGKIHLILLVQPGTRTNWPEDSEYFKKKSIFLHILELECVNQPSQITFENHLNSVVVENFIQLININ